MVKTESKSQATPQQDDRPFLAGLKRVLERAYQDGIDRFLSWDVDGEAIVGQFQDGPKVFEFRLAEGSLDYGVAQAGQRAALDSLVAQYPELASIPDPYRIGFWLEVRQDANKKNCKGATSYSCGNSCISNSKRCRVNGQAIAQSTEEVRNLVSTAKSLKRGGAARSPQAPQIPTTAGAMGKAGAIAVGAAVLGVPVASYMAFRANYRKGFAESGEQAKVMAQEVKVPDLDKSKTNVTFAVGGFAGDAKGGDRLAKRLGQLGLPEHHVVPISNEGFDIRTPEEERQGVDRKDFNGSLIGEGEAVRHPLGAFARAILEQGRNPAAVRVAAQAYAYYQQYPAKEIALLGQGAGGITAQEAAEILEGLGIKAKVIAIGSPYLGLTEPTRDTVTIGTRQDPILRDAGYSIANGHWINSIAGHSAEDYFDDPEFRTFLKATLQRQRLDAEPPKALEGVNQEQRDSAQQKQFLILLRRILERSYTDRFDRFLSIEVDPQGNPSGSFQDDAKVVGFAFTGTSLRTKLLRNARTDAPSRKRRKKAKCTIGITCRNACISGEKSCRVSLKEVASDREVEALRQLGKSVKIAAPKAAKGRSPEEAGSSIRDLKKEAARRGVYRYSYMSKEELQRAIAAADENPQQQERLRKTFERRKTEREALEGTKAASYAKAWSQIQRIMKLSGIRPELAVASVASILVGVSIKSWQDIRSQYRGGLKDSAAAAVARAEKMDAPRVQKSNITFAVGGFRGDGSSGGEIKQRLEESDKWFKQSNEIIPIDSDDFDIPPTNIPKRFPDGSYNPAYLGHVGTQGLGAAFRNLYKQRNEASVELAAQIYAYANAGRLNKLTNRVEPIHSDKTINIVAHGAGGMTAREAIDIIAEMPDGKKLLRRVNFVAMGSPDFGFTDQTLDREMTLTSPQDPYSLLPSRKEKRVPSVRGHEIEDYLTNGDAIAQITRFLGKGRTSTYYEERRAERERRKAAKERARRTKPKPDEEDGSNAKRDSLAYQRGILTVLLDR